MRELIGNALSERYRLEREIGHGGNAAERCLREIQIAAKLTHPHILLIRWHLPFDTGKNLRGQTYSDMTCIPLPTIETNNNPNYPR